MNPAVIDRAIELLRAGLVRHSCTALNKVLNSSEFRDDPVKGLYHYGYLRYTRAQNSGRAPDWWNANGYFTDERVKALEAFKQSILK